MIKRSVAGKGWHYTTSIWTQIQHHIDYSIVGLVLAMYGAIFSTFVYRRDRVEVVVQVRRNMRVAINRAVNPFEAQRVVTFALVTATNKGKRPVSIQRFSLRLIDSRTELLLDDVTPSLPRQITEKQSITARVKVDTPQLGHAEHYYVWDSVGRRFKFNAVPWYRRVYLDIGEGFVPWNGDAERIVPA